MYNTIQKTIAAWAFNHYIAYYYFDNVNVSQLKVAFEKGEVELENLPIKRDALQHFNLPTMDVVSGVVGSLSIKVPLMTLLTDPWLIKISNLMLIVAPKKTVNNNAGRQAQAETDDTTTNTTKITSDQSQLNLLRDANEASSIDSNLDNSSLIEDETVVVDENVTNSEETKLAEFYSSFSTTVSSMVRDIYKNIKLEIESMTILFEDFDHGLVKFSVDKLLLHRPKALRSLTMDNVSIYLSSVGSPSFNEGEDLLRINLDKCNLDIYDEASNNLQLVVVEKPIDSNTGSSSSIQTPTTASSQPATTSETKFEGSFRGVSIKQLTGSNRRGNNRSNYNNSKEKPEEDFLLSKRNILECDTMKIEFRLNNNVDDEMVKLIEKNLHIKLDMVGMQYIHSQQIYDITTRRLKEMLKFFIKLQTKQSKDKSQVAPKGGLDVDNKDSIKIHNETNFNKLLIINIEEGLLYVVDDTSGSCAIPLLEFSLDDCRILQFSGNIQQNGFVFAKIGCNYYNRKVSTWNTLLKPWPFNLSWDVKSAGDKRDERIQHKQISLTSDEIAELVLSSAFLDLSDLALKRVIDEFIHAKMRPLARTLSPINQKLSQDFNSIFVLHNETGHKLQFAPLEQFSELLEINESSKSTPTFGLEGDMINPSLMHKLSLNSRSSTSSRDSPDLNRIVRWIPIESGETISFEYETLPIYRRRIIDQSAKSRTLLVRVEGWKTLDPISVDKTGVFFREACADMVMNEDIYVVISIDLEESSARKIISVRSPFNLVNLLDATLEVHFVESNHALYIKPESYLPVPLPYLFNRMHVRPCNVGVTMSEKSLVWDEIQAISDHESNIHICHPITVTDMKHASYCSSQPYRICVATKREGPSMDENRSDMLYHNSVPAFNVTFLPPLTIVNLLPCKLQYIIGEVNGTLNMGAQQRIFHVDTTKMTEVHFKINGYPQSKPINIDPGATGSFNYRLEMIDKKNRSLYLNARIILASLGEEPAVQVVIYAPYWFINKTRLPLVFKQEGAALESSGQSRENEETAIPILLFSFYDTESEPPWLCSMRLGKSKGLSMWCDGFKLEKGSGERRLCSLPDEKGVGRDTSKMNKSLIDINIRRGFGRYSETMIVTFTARYGFDPLTKTPKKATESSPHNYKLTSYNHNVNLAERIAGQAVSLFNHRQRGNSEFSLIVPGFNLNLVDNSCEEFLEASVKNIAVKCTTKAKEQILDCSVQDIRINNLLPDCEKGIMLDRVLNLDESINVKPAIRLIMDRILGSSFGTTLFHQVQLSMCDLVLNIEEKLVLKIVEFISFRNREQNQNMKNLSNDLDRILHPEEDRMSKYYFDLLRIDLSSLKLSVFTAANLSSSLQKLKSYLNLKFFGFEDAQVHLAPYLKMNVSRTFRGVFESVTRFYKRQIMEQAPRIVGQQIQNYLRFHLSDMLSTIYDEVYHKLFN